MPFHSDWENKDFNHAWLVAYRRDLELYQVSPISKLPEGKELCDRFSVKCFDEDDNPYWEDRIYIGTDWYLHYKALEKGQYYLER